MDFLDPKRNFRHSVLIYSGYVLIGIAVALTTVILVYLSYGFGLGKNGSVIQNGLLYLSSQPNPASIYINGKLSSSNTNTRLALPSDIYHIQIASNRYRTWSRSIEIDGGIVTHYDYPLLIPNKLSSVKYASYSNTPPLATQSLDRKILLVQQAGSNTNFDLYNLTSTTKSMTSVILPSSVVSKALTSESYTTVAWANDNQHVILSHLFDGKKEYILFDTSNPSQSVNLSQTLANISFTDLTLDNKQYNKYYLYNNLTKTLQTVDLSTPNSPVMILGNVLVYDTYQTNTVLYATNIGAEANKVNIDELVNGVNYHIKTFNAGTNYLLNMAGYNGVIYVAAGSASGNKVYIYKDPVSQLKSQPTQAPVPSQVLFVNNPNYLSFSDNTQFIMTENAQQFGVFDIENGHGYNYTTTHPIDAPASHATWMDGDRLTYVSNGKVIIFDYDNNYQQSLVSESPLYLPFFSSNFDYLYTLDNSKTNGVDINQTSLLVKP